MNILLICRPIFSSHFIKWSNKIGLVVLQTLIITQLFLIRRDDLGNVHASVPFFAHTSIITYMSLQPLPPGELPIISQVLNITPSPLWRLTRSLRQNSLFIPTSSITLLGISTAILRYYDLYLYLLYSRLSNPRDQRRWPSYLFISINKLWL